MEDEINGLVKSGVIESADEPTDWCASMVVVPKPNGNVRLCVDLTKLNEGVRRELYVMKKVEETLGSISSGTVFSKLDANSGFHQVVLTDKSAKLTTFITPFGRFMFRRLPYGISSAPEYFRLFPVVPSRESPGRGTVPSVPSPESSATSVRRSKRAKAVSKRLIQEF